jgi:hypothetical protein
MMTTLATLLFTAMLATALLSLAWDLTRELTDPEADDVLGSVRAEVARIVALPRSIQVARQPLRVIGRAAQPMAVPATALAPVRRPMMPAFAAAA